MTFRPYTTMALLALAASLMNARPVAAQDQPAPPAGSPPPAQGETAKKADAAPTTETAPAKDPIVEKGSATKDWTIDINPRLWWVSPSGEITFPGSGEEVEIEELNLDTPEFTPAGSLSINAGNFRFSFFGASYSRDAEFTVASPLQTGSITLLPTGPSESEFDLGIYELNVGYRFYQHDFKKRTKDAAASADLLLDLYGVGGVRLYDLGISTAQAGVGQQSIDQTYVEPLIGIRSELTIIRDFSINLQLDGGGFGDSDRSSFSFNIGIDFEWRPVQWFGVQIGWRQLLYDLSDGNDADEFKYQGGMAGLFTGVVFRF